MIADLLLAAAALAQDPPEPAPVQPKEILLLERSADAEPHPSHVILPDPLEQTDEQKAESEARSRRGVRPVVGTPGPSVPPRIARSRPRPVKGGSPAHLHGRYAVVEITEGGLTEDYRNKMERAGRALDDDCIVTHLLFDFGQLPKSPGERYRPETVTISRVQECSVGGLGKYAEELTMALDVTYTEGDDVVTLTLPPAKVVSDYVRLQRPEEGDMPTPPQWLAPATTVDQSRQRWFLQAETTRRGQLPVLHLTGENGSVWHLEPDRSDTPFDIADRARAGVAQGAERR